MSFKLIIVLLILSVTSILAFYSNPQARIVNGTDVKLGEMPYMVSIRFDGEHLCGGAILDENHILTAAHCIYGNPFPFLSFVTGTVHIEMGEDPNEGIKFDDFEMHELYDTVLGNPNDIAILKTAKTLTFGPTIQPIKLPDKSLILNGGTNVVVAGWGLNHTDGFNQSIMKKATLATLTEEQCKEAYGYAYNKKYHICAGLRPGFAHCSGDSGGPLVLESDKTIVGIVSWSFKPCGKFPGVYTNVVNYLDWIEEHRYI